MIWVLMITSRENRPWPGDVLVVDDPAQTGLPIPSVVRTAKIATVDRSSIARAGAVSAGTLIDVRRQIAAHLE